MRKKGPIWEKSVQKIIVDSYVSGLVVTEILALPELATFNVSPFTIRQILKANNIKPTWSKRKRKPQIWDENVVSKVINLRNQGTSLRDVGLAINRSFPEIHMTTSTVVRILDQFADAVTYHPGDINDLWTPDIVNQVVEMYQKGMLIKDIRESELLKEYPIDSRTIRLVLKEEGVKLTGKKGMLRRWPDETQIRIVELYQGGYTFEEIKNDPELFDKNPTDYAIRNILKKHGITTRIFRSYKDPVTDARYRRYRDGLLTPKEESIIHKHLAFSQEGRARMIVNIGIRQVAELTETHIEADKLNKIKNNARCWESLFNWSMSILYDNEIKKNIFSIGLEFSRAATYIKRVAKEQDKEKVARGWQRLIVASRKLKEIGDELLVEPSKQCAITEI